MDLMLLSKTPACSLRICRALFSSLLAANLHAVLPNTLGILFATDLCRFLKAFSEQVWAVLRYTEVFHLGIYHVYGWNNIF